MFWVSVISLTERAGIRTPDNLIKSHGIECDLALVKSTILETL